MFPRMDSADIPESLERVRMDSRGPDSTRVWPLATMLTWTTRISKLVSRVLRTFSALNGLLLTRRVLAPAVYLVPDCLNLR